MDAHIEDLRLRQRILNRRLVRSWGHSNSIHGSVDAMEHAKSLAKASGAIVAVSGVVDIVTNGLQVVSARNGDVLPLLSLLFLLQLTHYMLWKLQFRHYLSLVLSVR
ncbi:hypothetical protein AAG906_021623 [Vitis piasezkii]